MAIVQKTTYVWIKVAQLFYGLLNFLAVVGSGLLELILYRPCPKQCINVVSRVSQLAKWCRWSCIFWCDNVCFIKAF